MATDSKFERYRQLGRLLTKYGLRDFHVDADPEVALTENVVQRRDPAVRQRASEFADELRAMGPIFVKFGQVLSTRPDIVPPEYIEALEGLQDDVEPFSFDQVEAIIETELRGRISKLFDTFEQQPLAAASLGQVHRATLRDGREVVVKVQRPGLRDVMLADLEIFEEIATFLEKHSQVALKMNMTQTVQQVRRTFLAELSYLQEAHNTDIIRENLSEFPEIQIPSVIHDYTTDRILTTELAAGKKVSKLTPLMLVDHDYAHLASTITRAYLKQICVDGFWHCDPHPGNVFVYEGRIVLLDFGMVAKINREFQDNVIKMLIGVTNNRGDEVAEACIKMGTIERGFRRDEFVRQISELVTMYQGITRGRLNAGALILHVVSLSNNNDLKVPSELALLAKTLLHLDSVTRTLDPNYDAQEAIRDYAEQLLTLKLKQKFHPRNFYSSLLDLNQLAINLPSRTRDLVDQLTGGRFAFVVKLEQADDLLRGMQKIANRITIGLVIAALIIGSSLIMRVPTRFTILGYPAIAMSGFIAASAIGFYLVISILRKDRRDREVAREKTKS